MRFFPILIILFLCIACSQDSDTEEVPFSDVEVEILFSPSGFGDSGYNDIILYGIRQSCKKYGFKLTMRRPHSVDKGWELYEDWRRKASEDRNSFLSLLLMNMNNCCVQSRPHSSRIKVFCCLRLLRV